MLDLINNLKSQLNERRRRMREAATEGVIVDLSDPNEPKPIQKRVAELSNKIVGAVGRAIDEGSCTLDEQGADFISAVRLKMEEMLVHEEPLSPNSLSAKQSFHNYLEQNYRPSVRHDIEKQCSNLLGELFKSGNIPMDELSVLMQNFYARMSDRFEQQQKIINEESEQNDLVAQIESYVCDRAYSMLFRARSEEEQEDLQLQERIRSLHWVTFGLLETSVDFSSRRVQDLLDEAATEIVNLNSHRRIVEKLGCLVRCSKKIFDALRESCSGAPASADEFLPVLIYVVLKANPPLLQSHLKFVSRFAMQSRIMRGETGYCFTNLSCALQYIQQTR